MSIIGRAIPSIRRRDATIRAQREQNKELRRHLAKWRKTAALRKQELATTRAQLNELTKQHDSNQQGLFKQLLDQRSKEIAAGRSLKAHPNHALLQLPFKLRNISLAASHGIHVPEVFRVWHTLDELELADLPQRFVLKADGSASSSAVLLIERNAEDSYRLIGKDILHTEDTIRQFFAKLGSRARAPFFAEELLSPVDGGLIPDDIKLYTFYGRVGHVLLRRVSHSQAGVEITSKYLDRDGNDLGDVSIFRDYSPDIPVPSSFQALVKSAEHLSRAVGIPFCRVDLYNTTRGVMFGEITQVPGGQQHYRDEHAAALHNMWIEARLRLQVDLQRGRPSGTIYGPLDVPHFYPPSTNPVSPGSWQKTVIPCNEWCFA